MTEQAVPTHATSCESIPTPSDSSSARQLRKSCRFCRSRKIRCSGETDTGCSACRNRGQSCIYEPTAAMGRPRKYPRVDGGSITNSSSMHGMIAGPGNIFNQTWQPPTEALQPLMRANSYEFSINSPNPVGAGWGTQAVDPASNLLFQSLQCPSPPPIRNFLPSMPHYVPLDVPAVSTNPVNHRISTTPYQNIPSFLPDAPLGPLQGGSAPLHFLDANSDSAICQNAEEVFQLQNAQPLPISAASSIPGMTSRITELNTLPIEARVIHHPADIYPNLLKSSPVFFPKSVDLFENTKELFVQCDVTKIFNHFKGSSLHVSTQAHLEFILTMFPNPGITDPLFKYPCLTDHSIYHTITAELVSFHAHGKPLPSNFLEKSSRESERVFIRMLNHDRGGNDWSETMDSLCGKSSKPLQSLSSSELRKIYSQWEFENPFRSLFCRTESFFTSEILCKDEALMAAVAGWYYFTLGIKARLGTKENRNLRPHMPFFNFAEENLMRRTMCVNDMSQTTIQALALLACFRIVDSQPRCGWALLSVAHELAKEYLIASSLKERNGLKHGLDRELDPCNHGIYSLYLLLSLFRAWTQVSMSFPYSSIKNILEDLPSMLKKINPDSNMIAKDCHEGLKDKWTISLLSNASRIVEVICTLLRDDPAFFQIPENDKITPNNEKSGIKSHLTRWLVDAALKSKAPEHEINHNMLDESGNSLVGSTKTSCPTGALRVVFSIFALSRMALLDHSSSLSTRISFKSSLKDVVRLLKVINSEGSTNELRRPSEPFQDLVLKLLKSFLPSLTSLLENLLDFFLTMVKPLTTDHSHIWRALTVEIDALMSYTFLSSDFSSKEELENLERLKTKIVTSNVIDQYECRKIIETRQDTLDIEARGNEDLQLKTSRHHNENYSSILENKSDHFGIPPVPNQFSAIGFGAAYSDPATASSTDSTPTFNSAGYSAYPQPPLLISSSSSPPNSSEPAPVGESYYQINYLANSKVDCDKQLRCADFPALVMGVPEAKDPIQKNISLSDTDKISAYSKSRVLGSHEPQNIGNSWGAAENTMSDGFSGNYDENFYTHPPITLKGAVNEEMVFQSLPDYQQSSCRLSSLPDTVQLRPCSIDGLIFSNSTSANFSALQGIGINLEGNSMKSTSVAPKSSQISTHPSYLN